MYHSPGKQKTDVEERKQGKKGRVSAENSELINLGVILKGQNSASAAQNILQVAPTLPRPTSGPQTPHSQRKSDYILQNEYKINLMIKTKFLAAICKGK